MKQKRIENKEENPVSVSISQVLREPGKIDTSVLVEIEAILQDPPPPQKKKKAYKQKVSGSACEC